MDFLMLITAYGKLGAFGQAESILSVMNKQGCPPTVGSHTALMEAYGRAGQSSKAESIFRRMQLNGPEPSALTYQIILKTLVEVVHLLSVYTAFYHISRYICFLAKWRPKFSFLIPPFFNCWLIVSHIHCRPSYSWSLFYYSALGQ